MELLSSGSSLLTVGCSCPSLERELGGDAPAQIFLPFQGLPVAPRRLASPAPASASLLLPAAELVFRPSNQPSIQPRRQWESWAPPVAVVPPRRATSHTRDAVGLRSMETPRLPRRGFVRLSCQFWSPPCQGSCWFTLGLVQSPGEHERRKRSWVPCSFPAGWKTSIEICFPGKKAGSAKLNRLRDSALKPRGGFGCSHAGAEESGLPPQTAPEP